VAPHFWRSPFRFAHHPCNRPRFAAAVGLGSAPPSSCRQNAWFFLAFYWLLELTASVKFPSWPRFSVLKPFRWALLWFEWPGRQLPSRGGPLSRSRLPRVEAPFNRVRSLVPPLQQTPLHLR